jgi:uronate dehydrogenase
VTSRVLITGAAGQIGTLLRPRLAQPDRVLRLLDIRQVVPYSREEAVIASITDYSAVREACNDVSAIVHLAGINHEAPWEEILSINVGGTRTVLEAARDANVPRVVLASSNHAAGFYRRAATPLPADVPARPDSYYGFSKAAMEALGALYSDRFGLDVVALRIGTCRVHPADVRALSTWLSPDDAGRLVEACLRAAPFGYRVVWGISRNSRRWWSLSEGERLGYFPNDDAETFTSQVGADTTSVGETAEFVGGVLCSMPLGGPA